MDCLFCKIIKGEIPSYTLYEDEVVEVFLDIHPDSNGHMLIIPKTHYLDLVDIPFDTLSHILDIAKKMHGILEKALSIDGLTLVQNNGKVQEVKHFHLHLKPYYENKQEILDVQEIYTILRNHMS